jgi:hypothetical protein
LRALASSRKDGVRGQRVEHPDIETTIAFDAICDAVLQASKAKDSQLSAAGTSRTREKVCFAASPAGIIIRANRGTVLDVLLEARDKRI